MWPRDTHTVAVRWTLRCAPRLAPGQPHKVLALDGVSEYKFNSRGFIREHSVRRQPRALRLAGLVRGQAALPARMPSLRDVLWQTGAGRSVRRAPVRHPCVYGMFACADRVW